MSTVRLLAARLFYHSTWNGYEDHLWFGFETGRIARSIAEGHGYSNPLYLQTGPTAWMTPVYPYLGGHLQSFRHFQQDFRPHHPQLKLSLRGSHVLPDFPGCHSQLWPQHSHRRLLDLGALSLFHLHPQRLCLGHLPWRSSRRPALSLRSETQEVSCPWQHWLGFGALGGLCALTNASTLTLCPILGAWAIYPLWQASLTSQSSRNLQNHHRWLSAGFLLTVGLAGTLLPWEIRN